MANGNPDADEQHSMALDEIDSAHEGEHEERRMTDAQELMGGPDDDIAMGADANGPEDEEMGYDANGPDDDDDNGSSY